MYTDDTYLLRGHFGEKVTKSDIAILFDSIVSLRYASGCEDIISELTNRIENLLKDIDEKECTKTIDNIIYYPNGLIKNTKNGEAIVASPWTPSTVLKDKVKKKEKHSFNLFNNTALGYQMKNYIKSLRSRDCIKIHRYTYNTDLSSFLAKIELNNTISDKDKDLLGITHVNLNDFAAYVEFLKEFFKNFNCNTNGMYFTDKNCEEILSIYDTLDPDGRNDYPMAFSYSYYNRNKNSLLLQIEDYITCNCNNFIDFNFNSLLYDKYGTQYSRGGYRSIYDLVDYLKTEEGYNHYLKLLVDAYNAIYAIQDENFRKTMIKLKIIKEGYIPNIVFKGEEVDVEQ